jgi:hypothetical protein
MTSSPRPATLQADRRTPAPILRSLPPTPPRAPPSEELITVERRSNHAIATANGELRQSVDSVQPFGQIEIVALAQLDKAIQIVRMWILDLPSGERRLQGLLHGLLGMKAEDGVGHSRYRQQRSRRELVVTSESQQDSCKISLAGHQAARRRPSTKAA